MYERSLNEAESILSTRKSPIVSVREVWEEVFKLSRVEGFEVASLADFSAMLEGDKRFQIIPAQNKTEEEPEASAADEINDENMENLGFLSEDRVRLRMARIVQPEISEDEEEVGSIRRRAFVSHVEKEKSKGKKTADTSEKKLKNNKKKSLPKQKKVKRRTKSKNKRLKTKKRGKK